MGGGGGGRLFEAGRLLTFSAFRTGAYSRLSTYSNKYGKHYFVCFLLRRLLLVRRESWDERKKKNRNEGGGGREWSNFHAIARLETLATQATPSLD